jgi:hypothetical protein
MLVRRLTAPWLGWALGLLSVVAALVSMVFAGLNGPVLVRVVTHDEAAGIIVAIAAGMLGGLIVARDSGNPVGWIFLTVGASSGLANVAGEYATYSLVTRPGSLPGGTFASWLQAWIWLPGYGAVALLFLLFPDGQLPTRRWRPVAWATSASLTLAAVATAAATWPYRGPALLGTAPAGLPKSQLGLAGSVIRLAPVPLLACTIPCVAALVVRLRRARGVERQQLKWFAYAATLTLVIEIAATLLPRQRSPLEIVAALCLLAGPAIGIFKHHLFDIDQLINRTVVYTLLSATLAAGYAGSVLLLQAVSPLGGSTLAVAGSTLAMAGLFRPARRRIQAAVDGRFNRRRYDATQTIAAFSGRLRDQVDLDTLTREFLEVVQTTMEPTTVSLWLRSTGRASRPHEPGQEGPNGRPP